MEISNKNKKKILKWQLENWEENPDVWGTAPPGMDVSTEELDKFLTNMVFRHHGMGGGSVDIFQISREELNRLEGESFFNKYIDTKSILTYVITLIIGIAIGYFIK